MKNYILGIGITAVLAGLIIHFSYQFKLAKDYAYKFLGVTAKKLGLQKTVIQAKLQISNNSDIDIILTDYDLDLTANGKYIAKIKNSISTELKGKSSGIIVLDIMFNPVQVVSDLFKDTDIASKLFDLDKIIMKIDGKIGISSGDFIFLKSIPINFSISMGEMLGVKSLKQLI